jgi:endonuclease/exonuclease/phosphatase family metal-dependent hydrolase
MTFNLHQGFNQIGQMSIREQADFIRNSGADIIALNEVSRGWLFSGSLDMQLWLAHELGYYTIFGPTIGNLNGNAFLSKQPLNFERNLLYTQRSALFPDGCLEVSTSFGGQPLYLALTHLNWGDETQSVVRQALGLAWSGDTDSVRTAQSRELTEICGGDGPTILLGDMNALPGTDTIQSIEAAGYTDIADIGECGDSLTWWALEPQYHLDYIFIPPEVSLQNCSVPLVYLSDHLPVIADVTFPAAH